jgi:hypothetical protein
VLKKLTATGVLAAAATGVVLLGGPASADRLSGGPATIPAAYTIGACYNNTPGYYRPSWCGVYPPATTYYPSTYYAPTYYRPYPGYHYGWGRWHHNPYRFYR